MTAEHKTEPWQEYNCPVHGMDINLRGDEMVYRGKIFLCLMCGKHHSVGFGVDLNTYTGDRRCVELPPTADDLQRLKDNPTTYEDEKPVLSMEPVVIADPRERRAVLPRTRINGDGTITIWHDEVHTKIPVADDKGWFKPLDLHRVMRAVAKRSHEGKWAKNMPGLEHYDRIMPHLIFDRRDGNWMMVFYPRSEGSDLQPYRLTAEDLLELFPDIMEPF